jgi:hypothetical protein
VAVVVVLWAGSAPAMSLRYADQWQAPTGRAHDVRFEGSSSRGQVRGVLEIDGRAMDVVGVIATDRSVTGTVRLPSGQTVASFTGAPDADGVLRGTATRLANGEVIPWRLPSFRLPTHSAP